MTRETWFLLVDRKKRKADRTPATTRDNRGPLPTLDITKRILLNDALSLDSNTVALGNVPHQPENLEACGWQLTNCE